MKIERALSELKDFDRVQIKTDAEYLCRYGVDWTTQITPRPSAVIFPYNTGQVHALLQWARHWQLPLVPFGGRTGLSGGAVAGNSEIVVSLERMNQVVDFTPTELTFTVQPGVTTQQLQELAEAEGWYYPVDLASKGSCHIGGNVATNAGGVHVIRYGHTRRWVRGLQIVTGNGETINCSPGLLKNPSGYDLQQMVIGSEGTLGIMTEAVLAVTHPPLPTSILLLSLTDLSKALNVLAWFRRLTTLQSFEFMSDRALQYVLADQQWQQPLTPGPYYLLIEAEQNSDGSVDDMAKAFERCFQKGDVKDSLISQSSCQAQHLWHLREAVTETLARYQPFKNDVAVRPSRLPDFIEDLDQWLAQHHRYGEAVCFGHLADGNVHINILKPAGIDVETFNNNCHKLMPELSQLIARYQGTIAAEHGIGMLKRPYLDLCRSSEANRVMRGVKAAFDPDGILNPGKVL